MKRVSLNVVKNCIKIVKIELLNCKIIWKRIKSLTKSPTVRALPATNSMGPLHKSFKQVVDKLTKLVDMIEISAK